MPAPLAAPAEPRQLVLYDGECGLCARSVRFLLDRDRAGRLRFAPLQGATAAPLLARHGLSGELRSVVFLRDQGTAAETPFVRSDAVFEALKVTGSPWRHAALLRVVPRSLRDAVYDFVARHRHLWAAHTCRLPGPGERDRFLP